MDSEWVQYSQAVCGTFCRLVLTVCTKRLVQSTCFVYNNLKVRSAVNGFMMLPELPKISPTPLSPSPITSHLNCSNVSGSCTPSAFLTPSKILFCSASLNFTTFRMFCSTNYGHSTAGKQSRKSMQPHVIFNNAFHHSCRFMSRIRENSPPSAFEHEYFMLMVLSGMLPSFHNYFARRDENTPSSCLL